MPLTLCRPLIPESSTSDADLVNRIDPLHETRWESLRHTGHRLCDQSAALVRLQFDWTRATIREFGAVLQHPISFKQHAPGDWTARWISLAMRHQIKTSALGRASHQVFRGAQRRAGVDPAQRPKTPRPADAQ